MEWGEIQAVQPPAWIIEGRVIGEGGASRGSPGGGGRSDFKNPLAQGGYDLQHPAHTKAAWRNW